MANRDVRPVALPWGERLRKWREEVMHWSRDDLREHIEAASHKYREPRGNKLDTRLIRRWEAGEVGRPQPHYCRLLERIGAPVPSTVKAQDPDASVAPDPSKELELGEDVNRRGFLSAISAAAGMAVFGGDVITGVGESARRLSATDISALRHCVGLLARQTQMVGGGSLNSAALSAYRHLRYLLDEANYSESVGRSLLTVTAEFALCAGWTYYDVGSQRVARHLFGEGLMLAGQADDNANTLRALNALTLQSAHLAADSRGDSVGIGRARETVRLADRMAHTARLETSTRVHALVAGHQTVARALAGDTERSSQAADRCWDGIQRLDDSATDHEWLLFVDPAAVATFVARAHRYRNEHDAAVGILSDLDDEAASPWNRANYRAQLAATLAETGDMASAIGAGQSAMKLLHDAEISSPRTVALLEPVRKIAQVAGD